MDTRKKIIRSALRELERKGLSSFSVRATGAAAGLSAMAMYRHFKDREDLLRAVGEDAFATYHQRVTAIARGSIEETFKNLARAYVEFSLDDPGRFEACFVLKTQVERIYPQDFQAGKSPVVSFMVDRIREAQGVKLIAAADAVEIALMLWAQVHGLVMLHRAGRVSLSRDAFIRLCEDAAGRFLNGLQREPAPRAVKKKSVKGSARK